MLETEDIRTENRELRRQLQALISHARNNEQILRRQQELELRIIGVGGLKELLDEVLVAYRRSSELDVVTLSLVDPEYEIHRMLQDMGSNPADMPDLLFFEDNCDLAQLFGTQLTPLLGSFHAERHRFLFPGGSAVESVAILPLVRRQELIGTLNLGSFDRGRFVSGMATDFIERMGGIVAISLENVVNGERLKHFGLTDALTGVHNRRYFEQRLYDEVARVKRHGQGLSCLFMDIDFFKRINDTFGHQAGDVALREVAARIRACLRSCDVLVRYGGEEFAALLVETGEEGALTSAERIRTGVGGRVFGLPDGTELPITLSVGVATLREYDSSIDIESVARHLVERADQGVYRAKQAGRNRVAVSSLS